MSFMRNLEENFAEPTDKNTPEKLRPAGLSKVPQSRRCDFRRDIALRRAQHLESDHEFANCSRAQQRRIEMRMEMPFGMILMVRRRRMEAHGIGEGNCKHFVVSAGHLVKHSAQKTGIVRREIIHAGQM